MSAEVIKEFLVSLNWKSDEAAFHKTMGSVESLTKKMLGLGVALEGAAIASIGMVQRISAAFESLYYASSRVGASAAKINEFKYAVSQLGGTAEGAMSSLENFARKLRETGSDSHRVGGYEHMLRDWGVQTRDAQGRLRDSVDMMKDIAASSKFNAQPYRTRIHIAEELGIDETTYRALLGDMDRFTTEYRKKLANAGLDPEKAAANAVKFERAWRSAFTSIEILVDRLADKFGPQILAKFEEFTNWVDNHGPEISRIMDQMATDLSDAVKWIWNMAKAVAKFVHDDADPWIEKNLGITNGLEKLAFWLGVLSATAIPALGLALTALMAGPALRALVGLLSLAGFSGVASFVAGGALAGLSGDSPGAEEKAWQAEHPESSAKESWIGRTTRDASNWVRGKLGMGQYRGSGPAPAGGAADEVTGKPGQFRKIYSLSDADLSDSVINHIAGEAQNNKKSIDAVINTMMNRLGTKAYGPSGNLHEVANAPGQWVGYKNASAAQAEFIRERIKAIASGAVSDITSGANEMRGSYYSGPWAQRHSGSPVIGGNRFAKNPNVTGSHASHGSVDGGASFGLNGWIGAGGGYANAAPAASEPIGHSSVSNYDFGSNVINHKPTIIINGAGDPGATADAVAKKQGSLYSDALRNLQGAAR
jgi:hypothetical protein